MSILKHKEFWDREITIPEKFKGKLSEFELYAYLDRPDYAGGNIEKLEFSFMMKGVKDCIIIHKGVDSDSYIIYQGEEYISEVEIIDIWKLNEELINESIIEFEKEIKAERI